MGNFMEHPPNGAALVTIKRIIDCGVELVLNLIISNICLNAITICLKLMSLLTV